MGEEEGVTLVVAVVGDDRRVRGLTSGGRDRLHHALPPGGRRHRPRATEGNCRRSRPLCAGAAADVAAARRGREEVCDSQQGAHNTVTYKAKGTRGLAGCKGKAKLA